MFDAIRAADGIIMDRQGYHADAAALRARGDMAGDVWKLERSQIFHEEGDPAWEAFREGDWERVVSIFESERTAIEKEAEKYAEQGLRLRRLRVVELPPSPYLQWEMHSHRIFVESGFEIGVLSAEAVRPYEDAGQLPELMVYGGQVVYQVCYDEQWAPAGAKRIDDPAMAASAARAVARLYAQTEPLTDFFDREIAPLSGAHSTT